MNPFRSITKHASDTLVLTWRNVTHIFRIPQLIVFSAIQPAMFMLLFTYVFGGAISTDTANYITYLLPGIIVQTVLMGSIQTGISLASDLQRGVMDRFRSLPMSHAAILNARTATDLIRNSMTLAIMLGIGFALGFRTDASIVAFAGAVGLTLAFGFAFSWISATIGMSVKDVETAQVAGFIWVFPLVFASSIFVPVRTMPDWLQAFANHNPISYTANTVRALMTDVGQAQAWQALAWISGLVAAFGALATSLFRRK